MIVHYNEIYVSYSLTMINIVFVINGYVSLSLEAININIVFLVGCKINTR